MMRLQLGAAPPDVDDKDRHPADRPPDQGSASGPSGSAGASQQPPQHPGRDGLAGAWPPTSLNFSRRAPPEEEPWPTKVEGERRWAGPPESSEPRSRSTRRSARSARKSPSPKTRERSEYNSKSVAINCIDVVFFQAEPLTELYPSLPEVSIPRTPSPFAVFAAVRATCMENKQRQAALLQVQSTQAWKEMEEAQGLSDVTADGNGGEESGKGKAPVLPKIVGIGLQGVLEIIRESRVSFPTVCRRALDSLLNILQGLQPEELAREPSLVMESMFDTLLDLASTPLHEDEGNSTDRGNHIRALACSCLLSLAVALGDTGKLLRASSSMLMSPNGTERVIMPAILVGLQRSVLSVMLAKTEHPDFMAQGVARTSALDAFAVGFRPDSAPDRVFGLASDGAYVYILSDRGLFKVGSGYGDTIKGRVYHHRADFDPTPGWIGFAGGSLFYRNLALEEDEVRGAAARRKETKLEICQIDREELIISDVMSLRDEGLLASPSPQAMLSDGASLGVVSVANATSNSSEERGGEDFVVKFFGTKSGDGSVLSCVQELPLKLARKCVDAFGAGPTTEDAPAAAGGLAAEESAIAATQLDFGCDDEAITVQTGKDFALMLSSQAKLYHSGMKSSIASLAFV